MVLGCMPKNQTGHEMLREHIRQNYMTQVGFCSALGLSYPQVSKLLSRRAIPTLPQAKLFRDRLGIPLEAWLVKERKVRSAK